MQLALLGLAMAVFLHDAPEAAAWRADLAWPWVLAVVLGPKLLVGGGYAWACRRTTARLGQAGGARTRRRLDRLTGVLPVPLLACFVLDLWAGALVAVRGAGGVRDWVLVDEVVVMLPTLGLLAWTWSSYHPIDRRVREATLLQRADAGLPIYPVWTRGQFVLTNVRNHAALILAPLLVIMAWSESLVKLNERGVIGESAALWLMPVGVVVVFIAAPLLLCRVWDTVPLPPGELRGRLTAMCERYHVRVRDLRLWRTYGGMINAAVMGLFGRVRFILLSDGLLDQVNEREVEAVMAHELGHVRLRHLWWLLAAAAAGVAGLSVVGEGVAFVLGGWTNGAWRTGVEVGLLVAGIGLWAAGFGWVSRRIERQADTFAARYLANSVPRYGGPDPADPERFTQAAAAGMIGALQRVADLNHIAPDRRSWRHGSIAWRQAYLRSLVGVPLLDPPIDRLMRRINAASVAVLIAAVTLSFV
ncbi:MAG: M48 family metallopeptidase [Planctomycetota bacterium]